MVGGVAPHVGDQWFHKRAMSGELENTGRRWPGGKEFGTAQYTKGLFVGLSPRGGLWPRG